MIYDSYIWKKDLARESSSIKEYFDALDLDIEYEDDENSEMDEERVYDTKGDESLIRLQKYLFYTSIIIRKLFESNRLTDELESKNYLLEKYERKLDPLHSVLKIEEIERVFHLMETNPENKALQEVMTKVSDLLKVSKDAVLSLFHDDLVVNKTNGYEIEKFYDLNNPKKIRFDIKNISHLIIHSFLLIPKYDFRKIDLQKLDDDTENWEYYGFDGFYFNSDKTKEKELYYISFDQYLKLVEDVVNDKVMVWRADRIGNLFLKTKYSDKFEGFLKGLFK